jgi:DNA-binding beta-propeller fold protein YncE
MQPYFVHKSAAAARPALADVDRDMAAEAAARRRLRELSLRIAGAASQTAATPALLFVGSFTDVFDGEGEGISTFRINTQPAAEASEGAAGGRSLQLELEPVGGPLDVGYDPSNIAVHPNGKMLYYGCEGNDYEFPYDSAADDHSAVGCCALDRRTGALTPLRKLPCPGSPAQMQVDRTGHWLLTANYLGGTVSVFSLDMDGAISAIVATHTHAGASQVDQIRQRSPHAHMVTLDATNRWAIVADLGTDDVHTYSFDAESGALAPRHRVSLPPGSGPRHMCFHPSGRCESLT